MFSSVGGGGHSPTLVALTVKYIPNRPAKNISSLASHPLVPVRPVGWVIAAGDGRFGAVRHGVSRPRLPDGSAVVRVRCGTVPMIVLRSHYDPLHERAPA